MGFLTVKPWCRGSETGIAAIPVPCDITRVMDHSPPNRRRRSSALIALAQAGLCAALILGCAAFPGRHQPAVTNPILVRANDGEFVWERTVDVAHRYLFEIERENKLDGMIETRYKTGASVFEPWHPDSVGATQRWESTLQSIRRKAIFSITPVEGGFLVGVQTIKELEDVARAANSPGAATFLDNNPLQRDLDVVVGQATPSGWISQGRDADLEQALLRSLNAAFSQ
jgi:hypothetical protein